MARVDLVSNEEGRILDFIRHGLRSATNFDWASAYATKAAFRLVSDDFTDFLIDKYPLGHDAKEIILSITHRRYPINQNGLITFDIHRDFSCELMPVF